MNPIHCFIVLATCLPVSGKGLRRHRRYMVLQDTNHHSNKEVPSFGTSSRFLPQDELIGTTWIAENITTFNILPDVPITLSFDTDGIAGTTGCNSYSSGLNALSENSFTTTSVRATRKWCGAIMAQERDYFSFLGGRMFFYELVPSYHDTDEGSMSFNFEPIRLLQDADELFLYDSINGTGGELKQGDLLASFVKRVGES